MTLRPSLCISLPLEGLLPFVLSWPLFPCQHMLSAHSKVCRWSHERPPTWRVETTTTTATSIPSSNMKPMDLHPQKNLSTRSK